MGFTRSPMTRTPSRRQGVVGEQTKLPPSYRRGAGRLPSRASRSRRMYSGDVPQQPPNRVTPASRQGASAAANSSGPMS